MGKLASIINKIASPNVGKVTHTNECKTADEALWALSKEARNALRDNGLWNQGFHGNEIVGVIAAFIATRGVLKRKEAALSKAIEYIGTFERNHEHAYDAIEVLEEINQILVNETIDQSIKQKRKK